MQAMGFHDNDLRRLRDGNLMPLASAAWQRPSYCRSR